MFATLAPSWQEALAVKTQMQQSYLQELRKFLVQQKAAGKTIYPASSQVFNAFKYTAFDDVKVVILGQDPYHGPNQAHGLCFSVQHGIEPPRSLVNIFKELETDLGIKPAKHGCLESWANQGVLLLNSVLTVEQSQAGAHQNKGWEQFTDSVISALNKRSKPVIFVLWGSYAQNKCKCIDKDRHIILAAPHPSPLSAYRGFLGCKHFSKINAYLSALDEQPIAWQLPPI
ncbi:MAG: uracil-DNA glycosylase [Legionellales bacterium]|nr:MAG: uracil-DNA glycosylase [Legionellales bacterium]